MGSPTIEWREDCAEVRGVRGFEGFAIRVRVLPYAGKLRVIGLALEPLPGTPIPDLLLVSARLAALDLELLTAAIASTVSDPAGWPELEEAQARRVAALRRLASGAPPARPRGGSDEYSAAVADAVMTARASRSNQVEAVMEHFGLQYETARKHIKEARRRLGPDALGDGRHHRARRPVVQDLASAPAPADDREPLRYVNPWTGGTLTIPRGMTLPSKETLRPDEQQRIRDRDTGRQRPIPNPEESR